MKKFKKLTLNQMQKIKGGNNPNIDPSKVGSKPKAKFKAGSDLADSVQ